MRKIQVHIADDHQLLIDGIMAVLSSEKKIQVIGQSLNGKDVIDWFKFNAADILILDINMPEVDGVEVLQYVFNNQISTKVIVLSSYDDLKLIKEVLKYGVYGYLSKKSAAENIVAAIYAVFEGEQFFSKSIQRKLNETFSRTMSVKSKSKTESYLNALTPREIEVLKLIANQLSSKEISDTLHISLNTVETHRKNLIAKLNVKNVVGLAIYAVKHNII